LTIGTRFLDIYNFKKSSQYISGAAWLSFLPDFCAGGDGLKSPIGTIREIIVLYGYNSESFPYRALEYYGDVRTFYQRQFMTPWKFSICKILFLSERSRIACPQTR
jgi:hypothetical protein